MTGLITVSLITSVVPAIVSFLSKLIAHGSDTVVWGHSIRLGLKLGMIFALLRMHGTKE